MSLVKPARWSHATSQLFLMSMLAIAGWLPRWLTMSLFSAVGHAGYVLLARDRHRIFAHLGEAMPGLTPRERRRLARRVFVELGRNAADVFRLARRPGRELLELVDLVGGEHFDAATAEGRGVVAVTGHLGAWELIPGYFAQRGVRVAVLARPLKYPRLERLLEEVRGRLGITVVHEGGDLRPALRVLREGGAFGMVIDQDRRSPGLWVPFLGRPARMPLGPAELARRTGANLLVLGIRRVGRRHRITVLPPVAVDWQKPGAQAAVTAGLTRSIESLLWLSPEQWTWMYDPWGRGDTATRPRGRTNREARPDVALARDREATPRRAAVAGRRRAGLGLALFAALDLFLAAGAGCDSPNSGSSGPEGRARPSEAAGRGVPDQEITQFVLRETDEMGRLAWILRADRARIYEATDEVEADQTRIDFYDAKGEVSSVLTSDLGVIVRRTNDMRALGHVVVRNREGHELTTEELHYSTERNKIHTDKFVQVVRERDVLTGFGLSADPDLREGQFEIQRDVHATVRALPGEPAGGETGSEDVGQRKADGSSTTP